jgi:hypothetical protein
MPIRLDLDAVALRGNRVSPWRQWPEPFEDVKRGGPRRLDTGRAFRKKPVSVNGRSELPVD